MSPQELVGFEGQIAPENEAAMRAAIQGTLQFIPVNQVKVMRAAMAGEEGDWFKAKFWSLTQHLALAYRTYDQEPDLEDGDVDYDPGDALVMLHYFVGGCDWWITELDSDPDGTGQHQAFGYADLGHGPELGYISIVELVATRTVELDLHWVPKTWAQVQAGRMH